MEASAPKCTRLRLGQRLAKHHWSSCATCWQTCRRCRQERAVFIERRELAGHDPHPAGQSRGNFSSAKCALKTQIVESERKIELWNAEWMIVAGRSVCTSCMKAKCWKTAKAPFSTPIPVQQILRNKSVGSSPAIPGASQWANQK